MKNVVKNNCSSTIKSCGAKFEGTETEITIGKVSRITFDEKTSIVFKDGIRIGVGDIKDVGMFGYDKKPKNKWYETH